MAGDHYNMIRIFAGDIQLFQKAETIKTRHAKIQENQVRLFFFNECKTFEPIIGKGNFIVFVFQDLIHSLLQSRLIINNKNFWITHVYLKMKGVKSEKSRNSA